MTRMDYFMH